MQRRIVVDIRFNNMGFQKERLTRPWLEHRLGLFRDLTLKSLNMQVNQNFLTLLKCEPSSVDLIHEVLNDLSINIPDNMRFLPVDQIDQAIINYIEGADELYIARIDSDDLFHKNYIQQLHNYKHQPETWALLNQNGYYWDKDRNEMSATFYASPQFYVLIYQAEDFRQGKRYTIRDHGHVIKFPHEKLQGRNWINIVHSTNSSPKKVPVDNRIEPKEINKIVQDYVGKYVR